MGLSDLFKKASQTMSGLQSTVDGVAEFIGTAISLLTDVRQPKEVDPWT